MSFVSSSDLTNYSKLKESEAYLKDTEDLKYVLRFLSILLSSTVDKQLFLSVEVMNGNSIFTLLSFVISVSFQKKKASFGVSLLLR